MPAIPASSSSSRTAAAMSSLANLWMHFCDQLLRLSSKSSIQILWLLLANPDREANWSNGGKAESKRGLGIPLYLAG
jgi:hypothetical protein